MAGQRLYELITSRGGKDSDYSDVVYGTVLEVKPLKIQLSNQLVLTDDFIILGKHIGKFKVQGKAYVDVSGRGDENIEFKKKKMYVEIDNSLEKKDKVTLLRMDGGQQYYLLERHDKDGYGF